MNEKFLRSCEICVAAGGKFSTSQVNDVSTNS